MNDVMCVLRDVLEQLFEMEKSEAAAATTGGQQSCSTPVKRFTFRQD